MTAVEVENIYKTRFLVPFPYADCRWLISHENQQAESLIPELDMYFSVIAGYSSSATRLGERPATVLRRAREVLSLDLFETYPSLRLYRELITEQQTPTLYAHLQIAEQMRLGLLEIIETISLEAP